MSDEKPETEQEEQKRRRLLRRRKKAEEDASPASKATRSSKSGATPKDERPRVASAADDAPQRTETEPKAERPRVASVADDAPQQGEPGGPAVEAAKPVEAAAPAPAKPAAAKPKPAPAKPKPAAAKPSPAPAKPAPARAKSAPAASKPTVPAPARRRQRERPAGPPPVVRAQAKYVRSSPRKARLVCDHIRGKSVQDARAVLAVTPRAIARDWSKLLESAIANAEHNHELVGEDLYVKAVHADDGPTLKRFRPRAKGRATRIRKRTSHLTILLTPKE